MSFSLIPTGICEEDGYEWFAERQCNGFYRKKKDSTKAEFLFHFPEEDPLGHNLYLKPVKAGDWLVFAPLRGKKIFLYHKVTGEKKMIPLKAVNKTHKVTYLEQGKFSFVVARENLLYFFPRTYPAIVVLDLTTMKLKYLTQWISFLESNIQAVRKPLLSVYFNDVFLYDETEHTVLCGCCCGPYVFSFDLKTEEGEFIEIAGEQEAFHGISFDGKHHWLLPKTGNLLTKWNMDTGETTEIRIPPALSSGKLPPLAHSYVWKNTLYFIPLKKPTCMRMDLQEETIEEVSFLRHFTDIVQQKNMIHVSDFYCASFRGEFFHFISGRDFRWYSVNLDTEEINSLALEVDENLQRILSKNISFFRAERKFCGIEDFVDFVQSRIPDTQSETCGRETIGSVILKATTS